MSIIRICDRCKEPTNQMILRDVTIRAEDTTMTYGLDEQALGELCPACRDALLRFARNEWACSQPHISLNVGTSPSRYPPFVTGYPLPTDQSALAPTRSDEFLWNGHSDPHGVE